MHRAIVTALLAVPLAVPPLFSVPAAAAPPATDRAALERVAARLRIAQPWADAARAAAVTAPTALTEYRVEVDRGGIAVGVERMTSALAAAARATFGDSVRLYQAGRMYRHFSVIAYVHCARCSRPGHRDTGLGDSTAENLNPFGRLYYSFSTFLCVPHAVSEGAENALGNQAGEGAIGAVVKTAGFRTFDRVAETPFNLVYAARP
jgi:hypothetical protein